MWPTMILTFTIRKAKTRMQDSPRRSEHLMETFSIRVASLTLIGTRIQVRGSSATGTFEVVPEPGTKDGDWTTCSQADQW